MDAASASGRAGVGFWGWVWRLLAVAGLTLAGAFYVPLYRAHKALTAEYASLNQRMAAVDQAVAGMRSELGAAKAKADELEARQGMNQTRERASRELLEQVKTDLTSKLSRFVEKGTLVIAARRSRLVVRLPQAVTAGAPRADMTVDSRIALCALSSVLAARGAMDLRVVARDDGTPPEDKRSSWDVSSERSSAVARVLVEKCKYPAEHVEAVARPQSKTADGGDQKAAVDLEIDPGAGAALTAL